MGRRLATGLCLAVGLGIARAVGFKNVWTWYGVLVAAAVINPALCAIEWCRLPRGGSSYSKWARLLAIPMVWECAYRGVFPSLYLQRFTFWNTAFNSIIVDRTFACIGELCWISQIALCLRQVDREISGGSCWTQFVAALAVIVCAVAEGTSYYNTATTNELWCAIEVGLWGVAWALMFPSCLSLFCRCPGSLFGSTAKAFLAVLSVTCIVYPAYNFAVDCPMYMSRYRADQAAGKQYLKFWPGLADAATRRVPTHNFDDWKDDMFWMVMYFSVASFSSIAMMVAPSLSADHQDTLDRAYRGHQAEYYPLSMDEMGNPADKYGRGDSVGNSERGAAVRFA